jgi:NitT/TauT family transport system substrate-binding protein
MARSNFKRRVQLAMICGLAAVVSRAALAQQMVVGDQGIIADLPIYIAVEKGYFKQEGIDVTIQRIGSGAAATLPLSTNQVQVVGGSVSAALFNAFARDWPVRIVMGRTRDEQGFSSDTLIMRTDLNDGKNELSALKGRKIAINAPASSLEYMLGRMLKSVNLTLKDVEIVYMPWPSMGAAMESKAIDAGIVVEPFVALYGAQKTAYVFRRASQELSKPSLESSVVLFNKDWMDRNPKQALGFTVAYIKGLRDYYEAMKRGPNRKAVVDIGLKYTTLKDPALYDRIEWSYMDPNADIPRAGLRDQQSWYRAMGSDVSNVDLEKMLDQKILDQAQGILGRVSAE